MTRKVLFVALTLALLSIGCFRHTEVVTTINNPFRTGIVDSNRVSVEYASTERNHRIPPGSLSDAASLVQLDQNTACFDVTLHARESDNGGSQTWTDYGTWGVSLLVNEFELVQPSIQMQQPTQQAYQGRVRQEVVVGERTVCVDRRGRERTNVTQTNPCRRWETRPITDTQWVPGVVRITTGQGRICFQNQGQITAQTTQITLKMQRARRRLDFTWELR